MLELIHEYPETLRVAAASYRPRAYAARSAEGVWEGYVLFVPVGGGRIVATDRETTQSTFDAVVHWAGTLSWVYLEGALQRALERQPEHQLAKRLAEIERLEAATRAEAEALGRAAAVARQEAAEIARQRLETARDLAGAASEAAETSAAAHEQTAAHARAEGAAAAGERVLYEHALARAEEAAASRVAGQHEAAEAKSRAGAADRARRGGARRTRTRQQ